MNKQTLTVKRVPGEIKVIHLQNKAFITYLKSFIMKTFCIISLSIFLLIGCNQASTKNEKKTTKDQTKKAVTASSPQSNSTTFDFENYETGKIPSGWTQYFTGRGKETEWKIVDDNGNKALAQLSKDNPSYHFNEIVFDGLRVKNVELKVKIKGVTGKEDQGGGFVWRFTDKDNYYVVRENPLEDNVVLYKVEKGKRTDLPLVGKGRTYGMKTKPLGKGWNVLKLTVKDDLFTVYLNDKELFQVKDETFTGAGKIGLWTKADAVSYFDDLEVIPLD